MVKTEKFMVSLSKPLKEQVYQEVKELYNGRVGGLSIFFETVLREYFNNKGKPVIVR